MKGQQPLHKGSKWYEHFGVRWRRDVVYHLQCTVNPLFPFHSPFGFVIFVQGLTLPHIHSILAPPPKLPASDPTSPFPVFHSTVLYLGATHKPNLVQYNQPTTHPISLATSPPSHSTLPGLFRKLGNYIRGDWIDMQWERTGVNPQRRDENPAEGGWNNKQIGWRTLWEVQKEEWVFYMYSVVFCLSVIIASLFLC